MKSKITTYDYNRAENSLTVTYESGTIRKYTVNRIPKCVQTYIMNNIIDDILLDYKQKIINEKEKLLPLIKHNDDLRSECTHLCTKLNYISELIQNPTNLISILCQYHFLLAKLLLESQSESSLIHSRFDSFKNDYNFICELIERFRIPLDDDNYTFTIEHLLSIRCSKHGEMPSDLEQPEEPVCSNKKVMQKAHEIYKQLFGGDRRSRMSFALKQAWSIIKGVPCNDIKQMDINALIDFASKTNNYVILDSYCKAVNVINKSNNPVCSVSGGADSDVMIDIISSVDVLKKSQICMDKYGS